MTKNAQNKQGFSLVIVAGMIVVLTIIVMTFTETSGVERKLKESRITNEQLQTIDKAMRTYHLANGFLPCPARRTDATNYGVSANCAAAVPAGITETGLIWIGAVPTRTLGLSDAAGVDIWGRKLTYAVVKNLATSSVLYGPNLGSITVVDGAGANITTAAAFTIFSHGASGAGATSREGTTNNLACGSTSLDSENCDNDTTFRQTSFSVGIVPAVAGFNDDFIIYGLKF